MKPVSLLQGRLLLDFVLGTRFSGCSTRPWNAAAECHICKPTQQSCAHPDSLPLPIPLPLGVS